MSARKRIVRVLMLAVVCAAAAGALTGCESGGGNSVGSDGHAGHNH